MKCQECGYVSFDDLVECRECGAALEGRAETEPEMESRLQKDLFSLPSDEDDENGEIAGQDASTEQEGEPFRFDGFEGGDDMEEGAPLPDMNVDFDPATADEKAVPEEEGPLWLRDETDKAGDPETVIDDETGLPDDLWVEESAGFLIRFAAFAVDGLCLAALLGLFVAGTFLALGPAEYGWSIFGSPEVVVAFYLLGLLLSLGYFTFFLGWMGRTPGKVLFKLDVRRSDGGAMSYSRAFLRWAGYLVSLTFAGLGFLWIFFDERKRGWHDYLSGTWVKDLRHET